MNPYEVLGVRKNASKKTVQKAGRLAHVSANSGVPEWYTPDDELAERIGRTAVAVRFMRTRRGLRRRRIGDAVDVLDGR